jgi:hypothetical protein
MFKFETFYEDRYFVLTIEGEITDKDIHKLIREGMGPVLRLGATGGFGIVSDMRKLENTTPEGEAIMADSMKKLRLLGLKVVARVFKDRNDQTIKMWQEKNVKAGYLTMYFQDLDKAVEYVKEKMKEITSKKSK